jgi:Rad3-related DNA helicase
MTRVIQAAGRLIRGETDCGVIALLCRRFLQEPYVSHLPRDWYERSAAELAAPDPAGEIRKFFAGHERRPGPEIFLTLAPDPSAGGR